MESGHSMMVNLFLTTFQCLAGALVISRWYFSFALCFGKEKVSIKSNAARLEQHVMITLAFLSIAFVVMYLVYTVAQDHEAWFLIVAAFFCSNAAYEIIKRNAYEISESEIRTQTEALNVEETQIISKSKMPFVNKVRLQLLNHGTGKKYVLSIDESKYQSVLNRMK